MTSDEKFEKKEHLLKTKEFRILYKRGASFRKGPLVLYKLPNSLEYTRIGFSVSSRNVKLATRRNRTRRLLREVFRKNKKFFGKGLDMAVVVKRDLGRGISYKDVEGPFLKLAKEAQVLA